MWLVYFALVLATRLSLTFMKAEAVIGRIWLSQMHLLPSAQLQDCLADLIVIASCGSVKTIADA